MLETRIEECDHWLCPKCGATYYRLNSGAKDKCFTSGIKCSWCNCSTLISGYKYKGKIEDTLIE